MTEELRNRIRLIARRFPPLLERVIREADTLSDNFLCNFPAKSIQEHPRQVDVMTARLYYRLIGQQLQKLEQGKRAIDRNADNSPT